MANMTVTRGTANVTSTPSRFDQSKTIATTSGVKPVSYLNNLRPESGKTSSKERKIRVIPVLKPKLSRKERLRNLQVKLFKRGLEECVKNLGSAVVQLRKNPKSLGAFTRIRAVSEHYVSFLTPSEDPLFKSLQDRILIPPTRALCIVKVSESR